jgi:hypothetical protein
MILILFGTRALTQLRRRELFMRHENEEEEAKDKAD